MAADDRSPGRIWNVLSHKDNELLVRVGPDTPMGNFLRRFWTPALVSEEVPEPDSPPVRVRLLGEDLVAFRNTEGQVGLIDAYCVHRRAELFFGRNEECGLRCVYHGWKFDVTGQCVDLPNVPDGDRIKRNMRIKAYPTQERGGIVWAYLGPAELMPPFPMTEIFSVPESHRRLQKIIVPTNWFQAMEGDVDSSHVSFLHKGVDSGGGSYKLSSAFQADRAPRWTVETTLYGLSLAAQREASPDEHNWRINQWLMPYTTCVAGRLNKPSVTNIRVPIDDENTMHLRIYGRLDAPMTEDEWASANGSVIFPEMIPGTYLPKGNASNDYLIDRQTQKTVSYTGIKSIPLQDYAVTTAQGGQRIVDRSRERLTASDTAIIAVRQRMLEAVKGLMDGREPPEAANAEAYKVRSVDTTVPRDADLRTQVQALTLAPS